MNSPASLTYYSTLQNTNCNLHAMHTVSQFLSIFGIEKPVFSFFLKTETEFCSFVKKRRIYLQKYARVHELISFRSQYLCSYYPYLPLLATLNFQNSIYHLRSECTRVVFKLILTSINCCNSLNYSARQGKFDPT